MKGLTVQRDSEFCLQYIIVDSMTGCHAVNYNVL